MLALWMLVTSTSASGSAHLAQTPSGPEITRDAVANATPLRELWTARSRTWVKPDGTRVTRIFQRPINVADGAGGWGAADTKLRQDGDEWTVQGIDYSASIPSNVADGPIHFQQGSAWIETQLRGADSDARVDDEAATFADVASGVMARWSAQSAALKEELVLSSEQADSSFVFDVRLSEGLELVDRNDGGIAVVDGGGDSSVAMSAPFAFDADGVAAPAGALQMHAERAAGDWVVRLSLSREWLTASGRAFPVTIDPTLTKTPTQDCFLDEQDTTTSYCRYEQVWVGQATDRRRHDHRGLFKFELTGMPPEANVLDAELWAYTDWNEASGPVPIRAHRVTSAWTDDATWNKRNSTTSWTTAGGDYAAEELDVNDEVEADEWESWTITDAVRGWLEDGVANNGVMLRNDGTPRADVASAFLSSDYWAEEAWPYLEVAYYPRSGVSTDYTFDDYDISDRQQFRVNVAGGNAVLAARDLSIGGTGVDLAVDRYYNSQEDGIGQVGRGWTMSVGADAALYECDQRGSRCLIQPDGYRAQFKRLRDGSFAKAAGIDATLVENEDGSHTLTWTKTGIRWEYGTSEWTYLNAIVDPNGNTIEFERLGDVLRSIEDTQGRVVRVTQNGSSDISQFEDETRRQWRYGYDESRNLTSVTDPDRNLTRYVYNGEGLLEQITDAVGNDTFVEYDEEWRVTEVRREVDGRTNDVITRYAYSSASSPCAGSDVGKTAVTNPRGKVTTYCWNAKGQVTSSVDALGHTATSSYTDDLDPDAAAEFVGTGNSADTTFTYNANEDLTGVVAPAGEEIGIAYWSAASNRRDPLRKYRIESVTDANGSDKFYDYDDAGNVTSVKDDTRSPRNQVALTYNEDGTPATFTDGESNRTRFAYDANGNLRTITPPSVSSPGTLGATEYTYDALSRIRTTTDGRGETLTYTYDGLDRITKVESSSARSWISYTYDGAGNMTQRETSAREATRYRYDTLNRMTEEDLPGAAYTQYGYDKTSNITSIVDGSGTVTYTYDDVDRTSTIVSPKPGGGTDTVTYTYTDPTRTDAFTVRTAALPGGATQTVKQDLTGKVIDILLTDSRRATLQHRSYDYRHGEDQATLVQRVVDQAGNSTAYTYADVVEDVGRLLKARTDNNRRELVVEYRNGFDKTGNRTTYETQTPGGTTTYTYAYNAANQLCWRYTGRSANACASAPGGATTFTYDRAGAQLRGENTLTWDSYGRLSSIDGTSTSHQSETNDLLSAIGGTTLQDSVLGFSRQDNGETVTSVVRNAATGEAVSQTTGTTKRWYTGDNVGSTIALTDDRGGQARSYSYTPDGVRTSSGSGPDATVGFAGGHYVGSTGLYHFGARYYDPRIGRWTSQDGLVQYGSLEEANRYGYAAGNPVNYLDPAGTSIIGSVVGAATRIVGGAVRAAFKIVYRTVLVRVSVICSVAVSTIVNVRAGFKREIGGRLVAKYDQLKLTRMVWKNCWEYQYVLEAFKVPV